MQPNFTLKKSGSFLRPMPMFFILCCLFAGNINAQQFINGNLSTGSPNSVGVAAPAGFTWSEMQAGTNIIGFNANTGAGLSVADNFTIGCGTWTVNKVTVFAYSTGFVGTVSPFTDIRIAIYNTNPNTNPAPIFGDRTTNRFLASSTASMYRVVPGASATTRQVWKIEAAIPALVLNPGSYWIEYSVGGPASNFCPPSTVLGTTTQPGNNAQQRANTGVWTALVDAGPQDMPFIVDYTAAPCAGTPVPGNTIASTASACAGINFNLSLQNCTPGAGITYQWQRASAVGGPYTNIPGATGITLSISQTAATFYRSNVSCGTNIGTSTPVQVLLNAPSNCYCAPSYTNGCSGFGDFIANVTLATLNNNSACSIPPFTYYSAVAAPTLIHGAIYPVSISFGPDVDQFARIWADWNQDGDFVDAGESIGVSGNGGANGTVIINMTIPTTATLGTTRFRVRGGDDAAPTAAQSCGASNSTFGEAEDYNINIAPCVQGVFTSQASSASIQCSGNASFSVTTTGSALTYQWQQRLTAASPWTTVSNGGVISGATTTNLALTNVPVTMDRYQYRAVMVGPCTSIDFSAPVTLTVAPLVATVSPAAATICAGSIQQLSITNASSPSTAVFPSGTINIPILDGNVTGINHTIAVAGIPAGAVVSNIGVRLNIRHDYVADLEIVVRAPNGNRLNLCDLIGGQNNPGVNFTNTFINSTATASLLSGTAPWTGSFRPDAIPGPTGGFGVPAGPTGFLPNVTSFAGLTSILNGNWTIAMYDAGPPDPGVLNNWSLEVTYGAPAAGVWTATAPNTMFTDALATVPYVAGSLATSIYVKPTASASYSVVYSTSTPCTSAPTTIPVTVINPVTALVNPVNTAACVGNNASFSVRAGGGGPFTYQWQVSTDAGVNFTNVAGATASSLTLAGVTSTMNNNRYRAAITAAPCVGATNSTSATLTVNPLPVVTLTASDLSLAPGQTSLITAVSNPQTPNFVWQLNGVTLTGVTGNTFTANVDRQGSYVVTATTPAPAGCTSSAALAGKLTIGAEASDKLWIYPNPTPGAFQVRLYYSGLLTERRKVSIFNSTGQLIQEKEFTLDNITSSYLRMDFDLSALAAGTYIVKVNNLNTEKIVTGLVIVQ